MSYPCCDEGARYDVETGANAFDHPGGCYSEDTQFLTDEQRAAWDGYGVSPTLRALIHAFGALQVDLRPQNPVEVEAELNAITELEAEEGLPFSKRDPRDHWLVASYLDPASGRPVTIKDRLTLPPWCENFDPLATAITESWMVAIARFVRRQTNGSSVGS